MDGEENYKQFLESIATLAKSGVITLTEYWFCPHCRKVYVIAEECECVKSLKNRIEMLRERIARYERDRRVIESDSHEAAYNEFFKLN